MSPIQNFFPSQRCLSNLVELRFFLASDNRSTKSFPQISSTSSVLYLQVKIDENTLTISFQIWIPRQMCLPLCLQFGPLEPLGSTSGRLLNRQPCITLGTFEKGRCIIPQSNLSFIGSSRIRRYFKMYGPIQIVVFCGVYRCPIQSHLSSRPSRPKIGNSLPFKTNSNASKQLYIIF
jgi:hypothetical protein